MQIRRITHKTNAYGSDINSSEVFDARIGFWATVISVDSKNNWVDVINDQGMNFYSIPLISREWVVKKDNYTSGERYLPPLNSRVFVLIPDGDMNDAFVLCSGYPQQETSLQGLWAQSDSEKETKDSTKETVTQGGWDIKEDYSNGNLTLTSSDGNIVINVNPDSENKNISLTAWKNTLSISDEKISVADSNENEITLSSDGVVVSTPKVLSVSTSSSSDKTTLGNSNLTVGSMVSSILEQLSSTFVTGQATIITTFTAQMKALKEQWDAKYS